MEPRQSKFRPSGDFDDMFSLPEAWAPKFKQDPMDAPWKSAREGKDAEPQKLTATKNNSTVEDWGDDDDFMIDQDDLTFRSNSTNGNSNSHHRDSLSSFRSDRDSLPGNDERHVHLPADDEKSTLDAITLATHAGIPIPTNVPPSALMGGTIKRLGGRKVKKIFQEDYGDDLELPVTGPLHLKAQDGQIYPESLRQVSGPMASSPVRATHTIAQQLHQPIMPKTLATPINLDKFRDADDDDDDVFGDGAATIKVSKLRSQQNHLSLITPPTPSPQKEQKDDDFEGDLELPTSGLLKLSRKMDIPNTPALSANDEFDWGEGSLGTRFGGTKRDAFSTRSSSVSAMSPSLASSITVESEDEIFDGLMLPSGPLDLSERLKRRKQDPSPDRQLEYSMLNKGVPPSKNTVKLTADNEDILEGLEFGEGEVLRPGKPTLHRNVKVKESRPISPVRPKTAVSVTFTNKPVTSTPASRLPRPMGAHERAQPQPALEPVSESGGPIPSRPSRRSQSRIGHSAQSSVSSVHTPTTPSSAQSAQFSTPRRRDLNQKASAGALRIEPTTTNAQLLRLKRSLPAMRHIPGPAKPATSRFDRPSSRTESRVESNRPQSFIRPKTPVDRSRPAYEGSITQPRKNPFLPAGASQSQSQHVSAKSSRPFRRHDSDQGPEIRPLSRAFSRAAIRSPSPRRVRNDKMTAEPVWQQINKPRRVRRFGDGHELDSFDDLPTSAQAESRYMKQPIGSGNKTNVRSKLYQNVLPDRNTPTPTYSYSPAKPDSLPHFARDTAASRIARETSLAQRAPTTGPFVPVPNPRVAQLSARPNFSPFNHNARSRKPLKTPQLKPHLISNLNSAKETKVVNGMTYNPATFRWEGNDTALNAFDVPTASPTTTTLPPHVTRDREGSTSRPVLITNMTATKGVKRVGNMIFDPQNMCWLKADSTTPLSNDPMEGFNAMDDDDPFKDIPDLDDKDKDSISGGRGSDLRDDWLVGEEFDVGPEFIRRQHEEESRWHRKCANWSGSGERDRTDLRWALRKMIMEK
ncbi:uncharacterized protein GGS25DRAFT_195773 [Hypoxylon fragiforme]|uniref:uncharacterized protein n=1 Tax=Hypoxylon fragiforme TaxID=63214 RepID=UPI0020C73440|nr:uncharacterized protein GGS25DRAFT_195773 [Hypoxylon fragiforme]KAI2611430.1 hypothetical protein GGS25DRAFT_195773 [Hypoxylon fragiforme]